MQLSELNDALKQHPEAGLVITLPDGSAVPAHFHVTEVGRVRKDFIDCGGTVRNTDACVLQVWVANDVDHRLNAGKLDSIIALAKDILKDTDLPVEIEYDVGVITQFAAQAIDANEKQITLTLAGKHTACLAPELCKVDGESTGTAGSGCCSPSDPSATVSLGISPNSGCC